MRRRRGVGTPKSNICSILYDKEEGEGVQQKVTNGYKVKAGRGGGENYKTLKNIDNYHTGKTIKSLLLLG